MMNRCNLILTTSPLSQPAKKPRVASLTRQQRPLYGRKRNRSTGKERDSETGLYYYGARYLDSKTSRWLSGDPAIGEYVPSAPVDDEARKRNGNLPGMGDVFNYVNLHVYHYAGNNPVKYTDPDGRENQYEEYIQKQIKITEQKQRIEDIKSGKIGTFTQQQWTDELGFTESFRGGACAATSLLNNVARAYAIETGEEMTIGEGTKYLNSAITAGHITSKNNASVISMENALAHMVQEAGVRGSVSYSEGTSTGRQIYSLDRTGIPTSPAETHFVNAIPGGNRYFDVYGGGIATLDGTVNKLTSTRGIRNVNYSPLPSIHPYVRQYARR